METLDRSVPAGIWLQAPPNKMKIATYNVNGINSRLGLLLDWLQQSAPDIVCLQELKTADATFPVAAIAKAGYGAVWAGQKAWNGVAILAKGADPIETRRSLPGLPHDAQSRYLEAAVQGLLIASIYAPNGNPRPGPKFDYKLAWLEQLVVHAAQLLSAKVPAVLAGDFNIVPTDGIEDIYSTRSWKNDALLQPQSRAAYFQLLELGWTDAIRTCHLTEPVYTFWDHLRNRWPRNAGLRIDHLLLSPELAARLQDANVERELRARDKPSDHAPAWVSLRQPHQVALKTAHRNSHRTRP
jgi:exodeoxyribonuclease III